jgi:hypothetical protein
VQKIAKRSDGKFYIFEKREAVVDARRGVTDLVWMLYDDYTSAVKLPQYLPAPDVNVVVPLARYVDEYDYMASEGSKNLGAWVDRAALRAGRG